MILLSSIFREGKRAGRILYLYIAILRGEPTRKPAFVTPGQAAYPCCKILTPRIHLLERSYA
jgi:hypothetical protein